MIPALFVASSSSYSSDILYYVNTEIDFFTTTPKTETHMAKQKSPLSLRLDPETDERLELAAERTKIKKHALAQMAVEAVIDAIEQNDFCLVVPIKFQVKKIPVDPEAPYPATRHEENGRNPKKEKAKK